MGNASISSHRTEFDAFLYSVIQQEESGASLTMLSLLARHDVDPWDEAANYARSPGEASATRLHKLLENSVDNASEERDLRAEAVALLERLPRPTSFDSASQRPLWPEIVRRLERFKTASQVWIRNARR
jgi:hypothetical protein